MRKDVWLLDAKAQPDAAAIYRAACARLFDITLACADSAFFNSLESFNLDDVLIGRCEGVEQRFRRDRARILADGSDTVQIILHISGGWWGDYDGRLIDGGMGTIRVMDMARPYDVRNEPYKMINVMIPRGRLEEAGRLDLHGLVISEDSPSGRLYAAHLRTIWETAEAMSPRDAKAAARALTELAAGMIIGHADEPSGDTRPVARVLLATARDHIDANLGDPDLSPEAIGQILGISRTQLYQLFAPLGGVSAYIQGRRLDRAFDTIVADAFDHQTLAQIGYAHGFRSDAHFSRLFRTRFGIPAGHLRRLRAEAQEGRLSAVERPGDVWSWLKNL